MARWKAEHSQVVQKKEDQTHRQQEPGQLGHILQVDEIVIADEACGVWAQHPWES